MCRHLLPHLAGGLFPVVRSLGRGQKRQAPGSAVHSAFPGLWSCPIDRCSPCQKSLGVTGRPIEGNRGPRTLTARAIRVRQSASRAMGDCDSACRLTAATRNFTDEDQRPCSIGNDRMWLRRVVTLPFPGSHGRIEPYDRGYRLDSPWVGIMAQDGRSVAM